MKKINRELFLKDVSNLPDSMLIELSEFLQFLRYREGRDNGMLWSRLALSTMGTELYTPEEDSAWAFLREER